MAKIVAFYYSQTGQGLNILKSVVKPLSEAGNTVIIREITPVDKYPFPWTAETFFEAFPETRLGIGCRIHTPELGDIADASLVIIVYPVWFLSPAMPLHEFFQDIDVCNFLKNKPVITLCGCRNMQVMAHKTVRGYLNDCGAKFVGNICLEDRHHNLVSVITIVRWLMYGKKEKSGIMPAAGVSDEDIEHASIFGEIINNAISDNSQFKGLQDKLLANGAVLWKPGIAFVENTGHRIFGVWAKIIRKNPAHRRLLLKIFMYYLFAVIYLISPVGLAFYYLLYPFRYRSIRKAKERHCRLNP